MYSTNHRQSLKEIQLAMLSSSKSVYACVLGWDLDVGMSSHAEMQVSGHLKDLVLTLKPSGFIVVVVVFCLFVFHPVLCPGIF